MEHTTGYYVWLYDDRFWYPTLKQAVHESLSALNYCRGEHNRIYDIERGRDFHDDELCDEPGTTVLEKADFNDEIFVECGNLKEGEACRS